MASDFESMLKQPDGDPVEALKCLREWLTYFESLYALYKLRSESRASTTQETEVLDSLDNMAQRIAVLATGCRDKEVADLTEQEQLALAIAAGCPWERTDTGIRVTVAFGIQKINGQFVVVHR